MKDTRTGLVPLLAMAIALCLGLASCDRAHDGGKASTSSTAQSPVTALPESERQQKDKDKNAEPQALPDSAKQQQGAEGQTTSTVEKRRRDAQEKARPEIEKQRKEAEQQAQKTVDIEAIAAIEETANAVRAIAENKTDETLAAIERATGKINILVARSPAAALIPVDVVVEVIDAAPLETQAIKDRAKAAEKALDDKDYPAARVLLESLLSELRVRTYNLPLATYPVALKEAARLLDQKKTQEASTVLLTALNTLVVIDRATPLPLVLAQTAMNEAQALREKDKDAAQRLLGVAKNELERAKELGYAGKDPDYAAMNKAMSDLEKQLKGKGNTESAFAKLTEKVAAFFKRQSESERRAQ